MTDAVIVFKTLIVECRRIPTTFRNLL